MQKKKVLSDGSGGRTEAKQGAHRVEDMIWIESWVDDHCCIEDHVPNVAAIVEYRVRARERQGTLGWVRDVLRHVTRIITLFCDRV